MRLRLERFSYRFAEQVLNARLAIKQEIESILLHPETEVSSLSRPGFNSVLDNLFVSRGWERQPRIFKEEEEAAAKLDFLKDRVGIEVAFGHASFIGIDLLKFQVASYSGLDTIDLGVYIVTTGRFQKAMRDQYKQNWEGSLTFEKVTRYLPHFRSAIQIPIYVIGIDI